MHEPLDSDNNILAASGLCYDIRKTRLIDTVELDLNARVKTVIMGANGTGKSLLLRLLHGLVEPSAGLITWRGRPLDRAARRCQSMVFQRPVLLRRSVLSNIMFVLAARGVPRRQRAELARRALARSRLEPFARRPARVLSGGEQQRLAIAKALVCSPRLLLLDEPSASLDPASTQAIERMIIDAHRDGVGIIMVTHDVGQARRIGEQMVFMHGGRVVETGQCSDILDNPQSAAAKAWLEGRLHVDD